MNHKQEIELLIFLSNLIEDCTTHDYPYTYLDHEKLMDKIECKLEELRNQD